MKAKHNGLSDDFLKPLNLTNGDLKLGLKLPLNAYTGCLRATFNSLYDNLSGFSICTTGQLFILQLIYDLQQVPTLEMVSANTDAVMYTIEENYKDQAHQVLDKWQELTGLELEEDKIVKIVMRDVNNYAEIVQTGDNNYEVHYKGGELTRGEHIFTWNKDKKVFEYSFKDSLKSNSLSIISEALLKKLLFDIPLDDTINKCNDIFRFQMISHLGSTYEKCVQESENGDTELQRNNRIYAGKKPSGAIIKVKADGRRDSLANCPPNPIVDNANKLTINDINKEWYIEFATLKYNDFIGIPRLESYKVEELRSMATELGLYIDKKMKKSELVELIRKKGDVKNMATKQELEEKLQKSVKQTEELVEKMKGINNSSDDLDLFKKNMELNPSVYAKTIGETLLHKKILKLREKIRATNFIFDKELPGNLGAKEYHSIGQYYNAIQKYSMECGLDFKFEIINLISFERECFKPANALPKHVATVQTRATFTDLDTGEKEEYFTIGQGADTCDKAVSSAETSAFRSWFIKNFSPTNLTDAETEFAPDEEEKTEEPKIKPYIPETKKEEIKKEIVQEKQQEKSDDEDIKKITETIMQIRKLTNNDEYGKNTLAKLMSGECSSTDILEIQLKVDNKLEKVISETTGVE